MGKPMNIRLAAPDDAEAIAQVHVAAWRTAYKGHMPDKFLRDLSVEERANTWRRALESSGPGITLVCESGGDVVGFCVYGPSRDDDAADGTTAELVAINIHPEQWRQGLGTAMCEYVLAEVRIRAWESLTLWVLTENYAARRFYEALGFVADGVEKTDSKLTGYPIHEMRYRKCLR